MAKSDVILERVNALHDKFDTFIEDDYKPLKEETKLNSEFRQKATGIILFVGACGAGVITGIFWVINWIKDSVGGN